MANPTTIRENLIKHLAISRQLHYEAKKILKLKFKTKTLEETIRDVAKNENLMFKTLKKKVGILREKQKYFALKNALEADPINSDIYEIAKKYKFPMIYDEINKRTTMGRSYRYNPVIQLRKIFTFSEEIKLMNNLCAWKGTNDCKCQLCALIHLSDIAYEFAKKKAKCPKNWGKKADLKWLYYFEMRHTKLFRKNFDSVKECKNFQSQVLQIFIERYISGSSSSSASMQGNQSPASFNVSPVLEIESRQSTSGLQHSFDVSLQSSIPRAPQQEGSESHQGSNVHIMEYIKEHINLSHQLTKAANQVLYEKKNIIDIALENDLDLWILQRKVEISKRTNKYLEHKFKRAIKDFSLDPNIQNFDNETKLSYIARKNDIGEEFKKHLDNEIRRHLTLHFEHYSYKKIIISYEVFTSEEEEEIFKQLYQRDADCRCRLCAMEYLIDLGYIFAKQKNILVYPSVWNIYEKVDKLWLLEFEMRNSEQIALYPSTSSCKWSPASTEFSSSDEQTEPTNTSSPCHQQKHIKSSKDSKVLKPEEKLNKIKGWIKKHVEISHQLDKAAKRVVQKNEDIGEVAHNRNLDLWMLNKKVHIIKFRKTQFDIKRDHEDAVNAVKFNILSVSSAAKEYGVDKDFIHDKLKKLKYLNSNIYIHDEKPKTNDTVLKWDEEFLLLNNLQRQVSDDPNCNCRSCALLKLPSLAYEFAIQNKKQYPFAWNTTGKAEVIWTCEFIMRHSREISNYFQKECMADLVSTNSSESF